MHLLRYFLLLLVIHVSFTSGKSQPGESFIIQIDKKTDIEAIHDFFHEKNLSLKTELIASSIHAYLVYSDQPIRRAVGWESILDSCPDIIAWQPNRTYEKRNRTPDDPKFGDQWYLETIQMPAAWEYTTGEVADSFPIPVVGVLEAGYTTDREDFEDIFFQNPGEIPGNGIDDDQNGYIDDVSGWNFDNQSGIHNIDYSYHGDAVVGIIAARGNNGIGITGINWSGKILPLTLEARNTDATTIQAYDYFYQMRKRFNESEGKEGGFIVATNSSFGIDGMFEEDAPIFCAMYDTMGSVGILSVGATSNQDVNVDLHGDLPSDCSSPFLIITNSIDRNLENRNSGRGVENIDLAAPGEKVTVMHHPGEFIEDSGTSFAAPQVSGVISLAYSLPLDSMQKEIQENPIRVAQLVKSCILESVNKAPDLTSKNKTGGYLNAHRTLECIYANYLPASSENQPLKIAELFPNAARENIHVRYQVADPIQKAGYTLFDILGKKILSGDLNPLSGDEIEIPVSDLAPGVYVLTIHQGKNRTSRKFVKM